jgi:methyltransferase-like protein/2-polyprenyl-3-methyl-5-hydroxy-6-metoxy-1,4-benzoquinol methylase
MTADVSKRYDEVPYESNAFYHSHPRWLATIATLFGMKAPSPESARILEIGCASGGNLIPMAESLAKSSCIGIDLSQRQIAEGQAFIKATGLRNVELRQASILDIDQSYGEFDYIVCHGVYSWVERHVQQKILEICGKHLAPQGVAYISYNTYPGWHMKGMLRDMMKFHASRFKLPEKQIAQSRALLNVLANTVPSTDNPYGLLLRQESEKLARCSDWYIYHEQLELSNDPVYFHEFIERARGANLQYLAESELRSMLTDRLSPEIQAALREVGTSIIYLEQYLDFFRNRTFRKTLLCRIDVALNRNLNADSFKPLCFGSELAPRQPVMDPQGCPEMVFERQGWPTITVRTPLALATLLCLREAWPEYLPTAELERRVRARLGLEPATAATTHEFADLLGSWYTKGVVKISLVSPPCTATIAPRPLASLVARTQKNRGKPAVTNLRHENIPLNAFDAFVLTQLDGTQDREALVTRVTEHLAQHNETVSSMVSDASALEARVQASLESLANRAFLQA